MLPVVSPPPPSVPKRAIIYAHFDPHGQFDPHVQNALASWRAVADRLVVVSAAGTEPPAAVRRLVDHCILRANDGYDFCSWKAGLASLEPGLHDEVVCVNDSVYGPLSDPAVLFSDLRGVLAPGRAAAEEGGDRRSLRDRAYRTGHGGRFSR